MQVTHLLSDFKLLLCTVEKCCITRVMCFSPKGTSRESQPSTSGLTDQQMIIPSGKDGNDVLYEEKMIMFYSIA